jgi:hypothetical protein
VSRRATRKNEKLGGAGGVDDITRWRQIKVDEDCKRGIEELKVNLSTAFEKKISSNDALKILIATNKKTVFIVPGPTWSRHYKRKKGIVDRVAPFCSDGSL